MYAIILHSREPFVKCYVIEVSYFLNHFFASNRNVALSFRIAKGTCWDIKVLSKISMAMESVEKKSAHAQRYLMRLLRGIYDTVGNVCSIALLLFIMLKDSIQINEI